MTYATLKPTTHVGIKSLAREIKRTLRVTHYAALDLAAKQSGFASYRAAFNAMEADRQKSPIRFRLFLSAWWWDEREKRGGRETLEVDTPKPNREFVSSYQMAQNRHLRRFRARGPDHWVERDHCVSQEQARLHIAAVARTLLFIETTGLRPTAKIIMKSAPNDDEDGLPYRDHCSTWFDPVSRQYVVTDEPYIGRINAKGEAFNSKRVKWTANHSWTCMAVEWGGMYYPDFGTRLFMLAATSGGFDLESTVSRLNALPPPVGSIEWTGASGLYHEAFYSPAEIERQASKAKRRSLREA